MGTAVLTIDLSALRANWQALNAKSAGITAAVVKADGYGLDSARVATALAAEGAQHFFVAVAEEGAALRKALGSGPSISVFSGHMAQDTVLIKEANLIPMVNSVDQLLRHIESLPDHPFGLQLDTGMNRLGMEPTEWTALRDLALRLKPQLIMSHLACADDPNHPMNAHQLQLFRELTADCNIPRSLSATGGILLGEAYHFEVTRPGIGLYGGAPFLEANPVVQIDIPVIQTRPVTAGETVGYSNTWTATTPRQIATISAGYADGILRAMGPNTRLFSDNIGCPIVGRISMDLICVDVTLLDHVPESLQLLNAAQGIDTLADGAGTIGYEILTSLGWRYERRYTE